MLGTVGSHLQHISHSPERNLVPRAFPIEIREKPWERGCPSCHLQLYQCTQYTHCLVLLFFENISEGDARVKTVNRLNATIKCTGESAFRAH